MTPEGIAQISELGADSSPTTLYYAVRELLQALEVQTVARDVLETANQVIRDLIPYAQASIGLPRTSWPSDSVILRAERFLEEMK